MGSGEEKMKTNKAKEIKTVYEPWSDEEKKSLKHTALQLETQKLTKLRELAVLEEGYWDIDEEADWLISDAKAKLKAAKLNLIRCETDKINKLENKDLLFKIDEAKYEIGRLDHNITAMEKQIEQGKPVVEKAKETPQIEKPAK